MPVEIIKGDTPVILALPYTGTNMQRMVAARLCDEARLYTAPDRGLDRLLRPACPDTSVVRANFHRFLSDPECANPEKAGKPAKGLVGVVPLLDRDGAPVWQNPPSLREAAIWRSTFYVPYHAALRAQIARVRSRFGHVVLVTCRGRAEWDMAQTDATPPDIRLSTNMGAACAIDLSTRLAALFGSHATVSFSQKGRMGTGWTTRTYGHPATGVHALELELNEANYLGTGELEGIFDGATAASLLELLEEAFLFVSQWRPK